VISVAGVPVVGMRCFARNTIFLLKGVLLTSDQRELLEVCRVRDSTADSPGASPPASSVQPGQKSSGLAEIQGSEQRKKAETRQIQRDAQPKGTKSAGRAPTQKEREHIFAQRQRLLGTPEQAQDVRVPPPPPRLAPVPPEEVARRRANLQDEARPGAMPDIPESVLGACLPPNVALRDHQLRVVRHMLNHRGLVAWHSVGSGKTLIAATSALCVLRASAAARVLFVSPKSLLSNFRRALGGWKTSSGSASSSLLMKSSRPTTRRG
jgi:hypothetical protein